MVKSQERLASLPLPAVVSSVFFIAVSRIEYGFINFMIFINNNRRYLLSNSSSSPGVFMKANSRTLFLLI